MGRIIFIFWISVCFIFANEIVDMKKENKNNEWVVQFSFEQKAKVKSINVSTSSKELNVTSTLAPNKALASAALFVVDTSIPMREAYKKGIKQTIETLFSAKNIWDNWGLATFDAELKLLDDFNTTDPSMILSQITINGQRTELNRASLLAIDKLSERREAQKYLVIFSDGEYEDRAYRLEEIILRAEEAGVKILAFGYRDTINLQNIRRLAEDTGGKFWDADRGTHQLKDPNYLDVFKTKLDNIFQFTFDTASLQANEEGKQIVDLNVTLEDNSTVSRHIEFDVEKLEPIIEDSNLTNTHQVEEKDYTPFIIGGGVLLGLLLLYLLLSPKNVEEREEKEEIPPEERDAIAYLETSAGTKYMIVKNQTSIGALSENDIVLEGEYISRYHAVLNFKDGFFYIVDSNSKNGVFVNYEKVQNEKIGDGDVVSFGPLEMVFKVL